MQKKVYDNSLFLNIYIGTLTDGMVENKKRDG